MRHLVSGLMLGLVCTSCTSPSQGAANSTDPSTDVRNLPIETVIQQAAELPSMDPMASLLVQHREQLPELDEQQYPVVLFWVLPSGMKEALLRANLTVEELAKRPEVLQFLSSHISKGDIPGIEFESPPEGERRFASLSSTSLNIKTTIDSVSKKTITTVNGVKISNCYFTQVNGETSSSPRLGKICYIDKPLIEIK